MENKIIFEDGEISVVLNEDGYFVSITGKEELECESFDRVYEILGEKTCEVYELDIGGDFYKILNDSFNYFKNLKKLKIPKSVDYIDLNALSALNKLEYIEVEKDNERYVSRDGILYSSKFTGLVKYPAGKSDKEFKIPTDVSYVLEKAFCFNEYLEKIEIGSHVDGIGKYCFLGCTGLKEALIDLDHSVLERSLLEACVSLEKVVLGKKIKRISKYAFSRCKSLKEISLPSCLSVIESNAFEGCENLSKIILPRGIEEIGYNAFLGCKKLDYVRVPNTVKDLGAYDYDNKDTPKYILED